MVKLSLKIGSFNIQGGLSKKCNDPYIQELIKSYDIFCVQESWLTEGYTIELAGFDYYRSDRKKAKKAKRGHGGIVVFFK